MYAWIKGFKSFILRQRRLWLGYDRGKGPLVVLLHGIGQSHEIWKPVVDALQHAECRLVAFDLLGFGRSPKPQDLQYTASDHAAALIKSIDKLKPRQPIIIVGHSMGALIAVHIASQRPDLVKQLVLYEMPLYEGLPNKRRYKWRVEAYYGLYQQISKLTPSDKKGGQGIKQKIVERVTGQKITAETWLPYVRSLQNTIIKQNTAHELKKLSMPIDVIYGNRDMLVIRGKVQHMFGEEAANITAHTIRERHTVSKRSSGFLANRIIAALHAGQTLSGHSRLKDLVVE